MPPLDARLIQGFADVPADVCAKVMVDRPAVAQFAKGDEELWYASPLHVASADSPGFALLRRAFARFPIASVVLEGCSYLEGEFSAERLAALLRRDDRGLYECGELGYAAELASRRAIPVIGGEPSDREVAAGLLQAGFDFRDVLGNGFLCYIPQWRRLGVLDADAVERVFEREMPRIRRAHGLESAPPFGFPELVRWYEERNHERFDALRTDFNFEPLENGRLGTQRIGHAWNMIRNRTIARVISESLRRHRRVLAVFGNGHLGCHWRALVAAFGEPVYLGDLSES